MNDNPFAVLTDEPVPQSRVRVDDVVAGGRARVRRRRGALAGVCAAIVVLVTIAGVAAAARGPRPQPARPVPAPSVSVQPPGCTAAALDVGGDIGSAYTEPSGTYLAFSRAPDPGLLIVYRDGAAVRQFTTDERLQVAAVNTAGNAVGVKGDDAFRTTADGIVVLLPRPHGALKVRANGVNATGDIVGEASMPGKQFRAVLWRHTKPDTAVLLPTPSGRSSAANGIADDGRIVGNLDQGAEAYLWQADGTGAALPTPPGLPGGVAVHITGDWADGLVNSLSVTTFDQSTGRRVGAGTPKLARWHLSAGTVEPLDAPDALGGPGGVTSEGILAVNSSTGAAFWNGTTLTPLPAPPGYDHVRVTSLSADGRVVAGTAIKSSGGSIEPFRWDCHR